MLETLDAENDAAWRLFHRLASRFTVDVGLVGDVLRFYTQDYSETEYEDLMDRLTIIYDIVMPVKKPDA